MRFDPPSLSATVALFALLLAAPGLIAAPLPPAADTRPAPAKPLAKPAEPKVAPAKPAAAAAKPAPAAAAAAPARPAPRPVPSEREFHAVVTVDATQEWKKNDPKYPGEQWSKGSTQQRYEITTRLRSEGKLEVRNLLDPDLPTRLEAKTIHLARQAKKLLDKPGQPFKLPQTDAEKKAFMLDMQSRIINCNGNPNCLYETQLQAATIAAAMEYPEAMEEDTVPGRYLYFLPYNGCPEKSRVTLTVHVEGVRWNKDADAFIPFTEHRTADTVDGSDGLAVCKHMLAVIDTQDKAKPMYQETIFVPRPEGITEYTENGHTSREKQYQPMPPPAVDWMTEVLRHAALDGTLTSNHPLPLPLNGNATWLGLWTGNAKVTMQWSFREVAASGVPSKP